MEQGRIEVDKKSRGRTRNKDNKYWKSYTESGADTN